MNWMFPKNNTLWIKITACLIVATIAFSILLPIQTSLAQDADPEPAPDPFGPGGTLADPFAGTNPEPENYVEQAAQNPEAIETTVTVKSETAKAAETDTTIESFWDMFTDPTKFVRWVVIQLANLIVTVTSFALFLGGKLLDMAMYFTTHMSQVLEGFTIVNAGWVIFRDLANMVFIFILVYASISIVIGIGNPRQLIVNIIVTAILINFSLFIAKAVVDASNLVALQFYNAIHVTTDLKQTKGSFLPWAEDGPSAAFMQGLKLSTVFDYERHDKSLTEVRSLAGQQLTAPDLLATPFRYFTIALMGGVVMTVAAFVFATGAFMLFFRIIMLMFLMMVSPLAFIARVLPMTNPLWNKWWHALISNAIFAPAYLAMAYIIVSVVGEGFTGIKALNLENASFFFSFAGMVSSLGIVGNYIFMIIILIMALVMSKQIGSFGAAATIKIGQNAARGVSRWTGKAAGGAASFAGRQLAGRAGALADKNLEKTGFGQSQLGSTVRKYTTGALANSKFFGKKSFKDTEEERDKGLKKIGDKIGTDPAKLYETMNRKGVAGITTLTVADKKKMYDSMSDRQKVLYEDHVINKAKDGQAVKELSEFKGKLNRDQREKLEESFIREFREDPKKLASHLVELPPELQEHMYGMLSARNRIAVEDEIKQKAMIPPPVGGVNPYAGLVDKMRNTLSPEEKEKTEKAAREAGASEAGNLLKKGIDDLATAIRAAITTNPNIDLEAAGIVTATHKSQIASIKEKDIKDYDGETLKAIAPFLKPSQVKFAVEKHDALSAGEKDDIAEAKYRPLVLALGATNLGGLSAPGKTVNTASLDAIWSNTKPQDVPMMDERILLQPEIIAKLRTRDLQQLEKSGVSDRLRGEIVKNVGPTHPAHNYIFFNAGKDLWT